MGKQGKDNLQPGKFSAIEATEVPYAPKAKRGRPPKDIGPDHLILGEKPGYEGARALPIVHPDSKEFLGESSVLMDMEDETTILKYLPPAWQEAVQMMDNEIWAMPFPQVLRGANPNSVELQLRTRIWVAFDKAKAESAKYIDWKKVYSGVCSAQHFYNYARRPLKIRFLLEPLKEYKESVKQLLELGMARLQEIITMPLTNKNGAMDPNLIEKVIKCIVLVDHRIHGGYTQRAELKAQQLSAHLDLNKVKSMEEIDAALEEMEKKSKQTPGTTIVIEQKKPMKNILDSIASTSSDSHRDLEEIEGRGSRGRK